MGLRIKWKRKCEMAKLLVIGLDCATPQFVFESWRSELPNLDRLMSNGIYGELKSSIPPITVPAWTCMLSSRDPGQLGFYGFRNRKSYQYEELYFANASYNKAKMLWERLGDAGLTSVLIGIPQTYPPKPIKGMMVGCFLTPDKSCEYTYPGNLKEELDRVADGNYIIDVKDFRTDDKDRLLDQIYQMTRRRFKAVGHYLKKENWDFFMFVEMGIDRIHHGFWRYQDKEHRLYEAGGPFEDAIRKYYRFVDEEIGKLLGLLDAETSVMVVSDHGAKRMEGAICVNEWLMRKGYLRLKAPVKEPVKLRPEMVDWKQTMAWGEGGYYSRIFFNVRGREPEGLLRPEEYSSFRNKLKAEIEALGDEQGRTIGTKVFLPEEVYRSVNNIPPDLIVYFGDLDWRANGKVGTGKIHSYENDTGPDDSNHAEKGIFILSTDSKRLVDAGYSIGDKVEGLSLYDITPTILELYGLPVPPDMVGVSLFGGGDGGKYVGAGESPVSQSIDYTEEDGEKIKQHLEDLGYL
jgi:predicted AlkP superfamily phosphohydrolase/phosphomutase